MYDSDESPVSSNSINVMLNPVDATAHWKISRNGLEVNNSLLTYLVVLINKLIIVCELADKK